MNQTNLLQSGPLLRDIGMKKAADNAEAKSKNWQESALEWVRRYPVNEFQTEQVRDWAHAKGLPKPPSARAWGAVMSTAQREGIITHAGYKNTTNPKSHATPAAVWRKEW
jgi:hypothetical protein